MVKNHMKRLAMPRTWKLDRKSLNFIIRPKAGKDFSFSMPLGTVLKEILHICSTNREVKALLKEKKVLVAGTPRQDIHYPVGLFEVIQVVGNGKNYRMVLDQRGFLTCVDAKEPTRTLCKIVGKTTIKGGKTQLNCFNGTNILASGKDAFAIGDVVVLNDGKIEKHIALENGVTCVLTSGKHGGKVGTVQNISGHIITVQTDKETFDTLKEYAFVVGKGAPEIQVHA